MATLAGAALLYCYASTKVLAHGLRHENLSDLSLFSALSCLPCFSISRVIAAAYSTAKLTSKQNKMARSPRDFFPHCDLFLSPDLVFF